MDFPSALLSFLAGATVRSLILAILPVAMLAVFRVKPAATRHAVLFLAVAGMLALAALNPALPGIPVPVLRAKPATAVLPEVPAPAAAIGVTTAGRPLGPAPASDRPPVTAAPLGPLVLAAVYLAGLAFWLMRLLFGVLFTRRLLRGARPIESDLGQVYESSWISVPLTVGWLHPRILLPLGWQTWERIKLDAVLVHEENHIRRGDWAVAMLAAVNRSLYWFNPLAWWLERRLATLAEEACDDAALLALGERDSYAQALLDMAAAVNSGQGRLVWDAMAMAKGREVRMRIERILDDSRQIPRGLTRSRWLVLVACSLPLIYLAAALRPVPAQAQDQGQTPAAIADMLKARPNLSAGDAAQIEQYLVTNPGDVQARARLILYYFSAGVNEPRLNHIYWLIANHPETAEAAITSEGITPRASSFNTTADYEKAGALWRQQASSHPSYDAVLTHAGMFFAQPGADPNEAERLFLQVHALHPNSPLMGVDRLSRLYATAILGTSGDPKFPNDNPDFGNRVRAEIENNTDGLLLQTTGSQLAGVARIPLADGRPLPPGVLNLNEHPLLQPITELGNRLMAQGAKLRGMNITGNLSIQGNRDTVLRAMAPPPPPAPQAATAALPAISPAPTPVSTVDPVYPALARQARIQGVVDLTVSISPDGHVTHLSVVRGHPLLVQAAIDAVKQYAYAPVAQAGSFDQQVAFGLPPGSAPPEPLPADTPRKGGRGPAGNGVFVAGSDAQPPAPQRIKVGGNVQAAQLVKKVDPVYPPLALSAGIYGNVTLDIVIAKDGTVESVTPVDGHPLLVAAAMTAVQQWVYRVTRLNDEPIEVSSTVTVPFELPQ